MQRIATIALSFFVSIALFVFVARLLAEPIHAVGSVIVSEVAWSGTIASPNDEWIELYNRSGVSADLTGWTLQADDGSPSITLIGTIAADGYFLLERTDDTSISDIAADQRYTGLLENGGEVLRLRDSDGVLIDSVNADGGGWPAGSNASHSPSMERDAIDSADAWQTHNGLIQNGLDADQNPISGTPRQPNSVWQPTNADLSVTLNGAAQINPSAYLTYELVVTNLGEQSAETVVISSTLPPPLSFIQQQSQLAFTQPMTGVLRWQIDTLDVQETITIGLTTRAADQYEGIVSTSITASSSTEEARYSNNSAESTTFIGSVVLINAVHFDALHGDDEAVQLINLTNKTIDLTGWLLSDGSSSAEFPTLHLTAHQTAWLADNGATFREQFGFSPDLQAADLIGNWPGFANDGDEVYLYNAAGTLIDTLVYKEGRTTALGWNGVAVEPYNRGSLGTNGQILYRRRDEGSGLPVVDTNSAEDWANSAEDLHSGRKVRFPGWDIDRYFFTAQFTETSQITISISPDNSHAAVSQLIRSAQTSIQLEIFSITNLSIAQELFAAAERGVTIDILLEGSPPGGLLEQTRYICWQLELRGGNCWFSISESDQDIYDRYRFVHAKFMIVDQQRVLISSDNFSGSSMPYDDFSDGTSGRRGVQIQTDAPSIIDHFASIWQNDLDHANHHDIMAWTPDHAIYGNKYGTPVQGYIPDDISGGFTYTVRYPHTTSLQGTFAYEIVQSPDNSLRATDGLIGLINKAGSGDTVYVQQLDERPHWGNSIHTPITDPNPRLNAYLNAARRGANVWIMLDGYLASEYPNPAEKPDNADTCAAVETVARTEGVRIRCQLTNPTDLGIHNKMVLAKINGQGFVHVGSLNGTEQSSKGNREVAIQIQSDEAYALLAEMFISDWEHRVYIPFLAKPACDVTTYPLISEVFYNPLGTDDASEFIEIVNPTCEPLDLSGYAVGDAVSVDDFEDVRRFPMGSTLGVLETFVVAQNALAFKAQFGRNPDFELLDSDPNVPNMIDDPLWDPEALLRLGNSGDEVLLRDPNNQVIDVVTYGTGVYPNVIAAPLASGADRSLERAPSWQDTDNGVNDMRETNPTPGELAP